MVRLRRTPPFFFLCLNRRTSIKCFFFFLAVELSLPRMVYSLVRFFLSSRKSVSLGIARCEKKKKKGDTSNIFPFSFSFFLVNCKSMCYTHISGDLRVAIIIITILIVTWCFPAIKNFISTFKSLRRTITDAVLFPLLPR